MKDRELFQQLHNLNSMKPDIVWKNKQRKLFLNQINVSSADLSTNDSWVGLSDKFFIFIKTLTQPVGMAFLVVFLLLTGGLTGLRMSQSARPGDSLYLAKIVGEKTQFALALSEKRKVQLGLDFAANRVREIKQIIADDNTKEIKSERIDKLLQDFKAEIKNAKQRIVMISKDKKAVEDSSLLKETEEDKQNSSLNQVENLSEEYIFSAGSAKTDQGIEVSKHSQNQNNSNDIMITNKGKATTTKQKIASSSLPIISENPEIILDKAGELLQAEDYDKAMDILDKAGKIIDQQFDNGEVKGVEETVESIRIEASSTIK